MPQEEAQPADPPREAELFAPSAEVGMYEVGDASAVATQIPYAVSQTVPAAQS